MRLNGLTNGGAIAIIGNHSGYPDRYGQSIVYRYGKVMTTKQCNSLSHPNLKMTAYAAFFLLLAVSGKSLTRSVDTLVAC